MLTTALGAGRPGAAKSFRTPGAEDGPLPPQRLFSYGTLQVPAVMEAVIGRPLRGVRAALPGYGAFGVLRAEYPGLLRAPTETARGMLFRDLTPDELAVLDRFEGPLYQRRHQVVHLESGQRIRAWTYMMAAGHHRRLSGVPWRLERFMRSQYPRFMQRFVWDRRALYSAQGT